MKKAEKRSNFRTIGIMTLTGAIAGSVLGIRSAFYHKKMEALEENVAQETSPMNKKQAKKNQKKMEKRIVKKLSGMIDKKITRKLSSVSVDAVEIQMGREKEIIKKAKKSLKAQKAIKKAEKAAAKRAKDMIKAQDA